MGGELGNLLISPRSSARQRRPAHALVALAWHTIATRLMFDYEERSIDIIRQSALSHACSHVQDSQDRAIPHCKRGPVHTGQGRWWRAGERWSCLTPSTTYHQNLPNTYKGTHTYLKGTHLHMKGDPVYGARVPFCVGRLLVMVMGMAGRGIAGLPRKLTVGLL